ncbi:MAG: hypothetical protein N3E49_06885 [Bacteroidia bacterium]|nr:hypothetical protein [Bacteroidia bacterium]
MWLLYGANGTTGRILLEIWKAHFSDLPRPVLAGRNPVALRALGERYGLSYEVFSLVQLHQRTLPSEIQLVVNLAGPYSETAQPWIEVCSAHRKAYMDICGEWRTFQQMYAHCALSVPIITAAGYDTVIGEGALYRLCQARPNPEQLKLRVYAKGGFSAGTVKSALTMLTQGYYIWRDGQLLAVPFHEEKWEILPHRTYTFAVATLAELITFPAWHPVKELSTWVALPERYLRWRGLLEKIAVWKPFLEGMYRLLDMQRGRLAREMDLNARSYLVAHTEDYFVLVDSPQPYWVTAWTVLSAVRLFFSEGAEAGVSSAFSRWRDKLWEALPDIRVSEGRL